MLIVPYDGRRGEGGGGIVMINYYLLFLFFENKEQFLF